MAGGLLRSSLTRLSRACIDRVGFEVFCYWRGVENGERWKMGKWWETRRAWLDDGIFRGGKGFWARLLLWDSFCLSLAGLPPPRRDPQGVTGALIQG